LFITCGNNEENVLLAGTFDECRDNLAKQDIKEGLVMDKTKAKLTVFFENPFWVGIFERIDNEKLSVSKVTFGAEPKDHEIWEFVLRNYYRLKFSSAVDVIVKTGSSNPKRMQREARKQTMQTGIGTKSQQALQLQREEMKMERRQISKEQKEAKKQRMFDLKQQKRKEKRRGR